MVGPCWGAGRQVECSVDVGTEKTESGKGSRLERENGEEMGGNGERKKRESVNGMGWENPTSEETETRARFSFPPLA